MTRFAAAAAALALVVVVGALKADDKKADPTGTWKWSVMGQNGQSRDVTVKLKLDGDKLTGTMPGRNNMDTPIEEATFKDGEISFKVTRDRNGTKTTTTYTGKLTGDTIKGKVTRPGANGGEATTTDWEAKKQKDPS
jgi:hypothetical protein